MFYIIETGEQLAKLPLSDECFIEIIPMNHQYHPSLTRVSLVYYNNFNKGYIISIEHSEAFTQDIEKVIDFIASHSKIWVWDSKWSSYFLPNLNLIDIHSKQLAIGEKSQKPQTDTTYHTKIYREVGNMENINYIIPISKHYERCERLFSMTKFQNPKTIDITKEYKWVEESGIGIIRDIVSTYKLQTPQFSIKSGKIFTYYNLYNQTGRPTNSFGGINFLAIPKQEEIRKCFIPTNDYFVEFDFDAYHPRLVAREMRITLPSSSLHEYFAKQYFSVTTPTQDEYKKSKELTFRQMYGGVMKEWEGIEFFSKLDEFVQKMWKEYLDRGWIDLITGIRINRSQEFTPYKLFNYWVQNLETYNNWEILKKLKELLINKKTRPILVTYDSFLFDFSIDDGKDTLTQIKNILQGDGMLVKHKWGNDLNLV